MGVNLTNLYVSESFQKLMQISGSDITDGTGSLITNLNVTASFAVSASHEIIKEVSSSYAETASLADVALTAFTASFLTGTVESASYADTAVSASYALSSSYANVTDTAVSSSYADNAATADTVVSSSFASNSATSDLATLATTANTASFVGDAMKTGSISGNTLTFTKFDGTSFNLVVSQTGSVESASYADTSLSASHAVNADTASYVVTAQTASYVAAGNIDGTVANATSASHAVASDTSISASHAVNADIAISSSYATNAGTAVTASYVASTNVDGTVEFADYANNTIVYGKNLSGGTIPKGTPLYFTASGVSGNVVGVYAASASYANRMPAGGIAGEDITAGAEGKVFLDGFINGVNTSAFASGDQIWVAGEGGYTNVRPTGSTTEIQPLGYVEKSAINGAGVIQGPGVSRALPNIQTDYVWIGNGTGTAVSVASSSLLVDTASLALNVDSAAVLNVAAITASSATFTSASIGYLQTVTGSATIIGDNFLVLNNDTPTQRYAGIKVFDSGSSLATASLQFDGQTNDWFYEYTASGDPDNFGVVLFGPEYGTIGSPTYPSANTLVKSDGGHHLNDSNISDNGSIIFLGVATEVTGGLDVSGGITSTGTNFMDISGNAATATSATFLNIQTDTTNAAYPVPYVTTTGASGEIAYDSTFDYNPNSNTLTISGGTIVATNFTGTGSYIAAANVDGTVANATSASYAVNASSADSAITAITANTASYVAAGNIDGTVANATSASYANNASTADSATSATSATTATTASYVAAGNIDGTVANATSASYAVSSSYSVTADTGSVSVNLNSSSGSIGFWQGSQTEYDAISGSASNNVIYFVVA